MLPAVWGSLRLTNALRRDQTRVELVRWRWDGPAAAASPASPAGSPALGLGLYWPRGPCVDCVGELRDCCCLAPRKSTCVQAGVLAGTGMDGTP